MASLPLRAILSRVSRSFYLSLRLLPSETRETVALAYLLARATDTVADTRIVSPARRCQLLDGLAARFQGTGSGDAELIRELAELGEADDVIPEERALLRELPACLALLEALDARDAELVRAVLATITAGQRADLERFPGETAEELRACSDRAQLLHYCYQVAGCVGEFWSRLHLRRLPSLRWIEPEPWCAEARRFGRALQLTNILRDLRRDLLHGRCYLPRDELAGRGLAPEDLLRPAAWLDLLPLYRELLALAVADATAGLRYTLRIPPRELRLRLAGLLPLLLALQTLGMALHHNPLDPASRRKVPRRAVYGTLLRGLAAVRSDRALVALFRRTLRDAGLTAYAPRTLRAGASPS